MGQDYCSIWRQLSASLSLNAIPSAVVPQIPPPLMGPRLERGGAPCGPAICSTSQQPSQSAAVLTGHSPPQQGCPQCQGCTTYKLDEKKRRKTIGAWGLRGLSSGAGVNNIELVSQIWPIERVLTPQIISRATKMWRRFTDTSISIGSKSIISNLGQCWVHQNWERTVNLVSSQVLKLASTKSA
jgi:hypothetical protein